jgi:hypothetical protein
MDKVIALCTLAAALVYPAGSSASASLQTASPPLAWDFASEHSAAAGFSEAASHSTVRIWGMVRDARGGPLADATIAVRGVAERSGENVRYSTSTDQTGRYLLTGVAPGRYRAEGSAVAHYNGETWFVALHPIGDEGEFTTDTDVRRDFEWRLTGLRPGHSPHNFLDFYGGTVSVAATVEGGLSITREMPEAQRRAIAVELTLTPTGPLIDGSRGRTITRTATLDDVVRGGAELFDIPIGNYAATATLVHPNGARQPVLSAFFGGSAQWQTELRFPQDGQSTGALYQHYAEKLNLLLLIQYQGPQQ